MLNNFILITYIFAIVAFLILVFALIAILYNFQIAPKGV